MAVMRQTKSLLLLAITSTFALTGAVLSEERGIRIDLARHPVPDIQTLEPGPLADLVRYGRELVERTYAHIGPEVPDPAMRFTGNNLACASCHLEAGTKPYAMPFVGVAATFPQYRAREDDISTLEERVNGCMQRSMNGRPLPTDSREMKAFLAYFAFLSQGVPIGATIEGAGVQMVRMPNRRADPQAGARIYAEKCASCHGDDGRGVRVGEAGDAQGYAIPPVWGPDSFNTGAGMHRLAMATRFILANMPPGASHDAPQLTLDEAYDVAAFINSHPRPEKAGLERDFPARWNKPVDAPFPPYLLGTADQHKYGPFPPLLEQQRRMKEALIEYARREREGRPTN